MRSTLHNGRKHANGKAYNPKHNDRQYSVPEDGKGYFENYQKRQQNVCWNCYDPVFANGSRREYSPSATEYALYAGGQMTFEEVEKRFYEEHFRKAYEATQLRYTKKRQYGRLRTFDEWRMQNPPEEEWMQVGSVEDGTITPEQFKPIYTEYIDWQMQWSLEHGNPFTVVDYSMHFDELIPHGQLKRVWHYTDDDGIERPGQEKALERAGVPLPHPDKKKGRYNNRKQTFTDECRKKWQEIIQAHGIQIETEPVKRTDKRHKEQSMYWADELSRRESEVSMRETAASVREGQLDEREENLVNVSKRLRKKIKAVEKREKDAEIREKQLDNREEHIVSEIMARARELAIQMADSDEIEQSSVGSGRRLPEVDY